MVKKTSKKIAKPMPINDMDMMDMQVYAARYAHNRRSYATQTMNQITAQLLDAGFVLRHDEGEVVLLSP
jgi:hypothetical protein